MLREIWVEVSGSVADKVWLRTAAVVVASSSSALVIVLVPLLCCHGSVALFNFSQFPSLRSPARSAKASVEAKKTPLGSINLGFRVQGLGFIYMCTRHTPKPYSIKDPETSLSEDRHVCTLKE